MTNISPRGRRWLSWLFSTEVALVGAIVAVVLVLIGSASYMQRRARWERMEKAANEASLRETLLILRSAIAKFHSVSSRQPAGTDPVRYDIPISSV